VIIFYDKDFLIKIKYKENSTKEVLMQPIELYQKPTCTTCRKVRTEIEKSNNDFESINYYEKPFTAAALEKLLLKLKMKPSEILRKKESIYKELGLAKKQLSDKEWIQLMVQYPDLIERPIVVKGARAVLARPVEKVHELLG